MQRLRKGDKVVVISGKSKGVKGTVLEVLGATDRVIVEGAHKVKRHTKPTQKNQQGGILEKDVPLHVSKVMLLDSKTDKPTRVRTGRDKDGKKTRIATRSGAVIGA
jgi:large subunit ribosomal protein L24